MEYVNKIFKMYFVYLNGAGKKFHHLGKGGGEPGTADVIWELSSNSSFSHGSSSFLEFN